MLSIRTCIHCRRQGFRSEFIRIVGRDSTAIVDQAARLPGRGAWLHRHCLDQVSARTVARQLRMAITDVSDLKKCQIAQNEHPETESG